MPWKFNQFTEELDYYVAVDATNVDAAGAVMESDFDATTFLYATLNNTPQPKTPAEVMAILSGQAGAAFSWNSQNLTAVGSVVVDDGGTIGQAAGPLLTFDDSNDNLDIIGCSVNIEAENAATRGLRIDGYESSFGTIVNAINSGIVMSLADTSGSTVVLFRSYGDSFLKAGNLGIGTDSFGASMVGGMQFGNATAPTGNVADTFALYAADRGGVAGKSSMHVRCEDGTVHVFGDRVGINTATPARALDVGGDIEGGTYTIFIPNIRRVGQPVRVISDNDKVALQTNALDRLTAENNGNIGINATYFGATMAKGIQIANATAPTGNIADTFAFYAGDLGGVAGNSGPIFRTENGTVIQLDQSLLTTDKPTYAGAILTDDLILPKTSGKGIAVDPAAPTFGWRDLQGDILVKTVGANDPDYSDYASTGIYRHQFKNTAMTEVFNSYHIPHDYVPGTEVYIHVHWSQTIIDSGGNAKWYFDANYSKGHDRGAFPANVTTVSVVQAASGTIRKHMIAEVLLSTSGQIDGQDLEPDGIVTVRTYRDSDDVADTLDQRPWVHHVDIHYQSTNIATKDKVPDFYT